MKTIAAIGVIGALTWWSLWFTPDQQGQRLMMRGNFQAAAEAFRDPVWQGTAWFRAGEFEKAEQAFAHTGTAESEFNRGNCLVMRGKYEDAILFVHFTSPLLLLLATVNAVEGQVGDGDGSLGIHRPKAGHSTDYEDTKRAVNFVIATSAKAPGGHGQQQQTTQRSKDRKKGASALSILWFPRFAWEP